LRSVVRVRPVELDVWVESRRVGSIFDWHGEWHWTLSRHLSRTERLVFAPSRAAALRALMAKAESIRLSRKRWGKRPSTPRGTKLRAGCENLARPKPS
jgi:hypothetical protein